MSVVKINTDNLGVNAPGLPEDKELQRLRSVNSLYEVCNPRWDFYMEAYQGGEEFANGRNLFKHSRENPRDFDDRCLRIHNMNYCESLVDFFTNFIFADTIERTGGGNEAFYRSFVLDVNKKKDPVDAFMRKVCTDAQVYGQSYILVDMPPLPDDPYFSKADEADLGISPYWVLIRPSEITDWVEDDFGRLVYAKRKQFTTEVVAYRQVRYEKYTEFYSGQIVVTLVDITNRDKPEVLPAVTTANPVGVIPIVVARYKEDRNNPFVGLSFLRDFAFNQREVMNLTSLLQEFLYRQCFNVLAMETETAFPAKEDTDGDLGTSNVVNYPKGAKAPSYISPPADPAKFLQDERQRVKNEMFLRASQDAINELFNGEKSSGFAQAQSFYKTVPFISSRADMLESVETQLMQLTMLWLGKEWDGKIQYKDRYELTNITTALTQFQILTRDLQITSETFVKAELKRLVHAYDGKLTVDEQTKVDSEIDAIVFTDWISVQKEALLGVSGTSPGSQQKPKDTMTIDEHAKEAKVDDSAATRLKE